MNLNCARCNAPAATAMSFNYGDRQMWLDDLDPAFLPGTAYPLCDRHASRMTPPIGWMLSDRRNPVRPLFLTLEVA